ncbi:MAG: PAS domain S-box protein [Anaerolineales bacterium]|nr:PAS domain S-box protein [Anaerolineales bacterium]
MLLIRDVSQQREAEEKIRLQTAALVAAANGIVITDRSGCVEWSNPAFSAMTGYATEEIVGGNLNMLRSNQQDPVFYQQLWHTILAGQIWTGELVNRRKDGSLYTEEQTIAPVHNEAGDLTHFIAIKQDVSQRKAVQQKLKDSETRYRSLVETSPDGILLTDLSGEILFSNEKMARMVHAASRDHLIGRHTSEFITPADYARVLENLDRLVTTRVTRSNEYELIDFNGDLLPVEISSSVIEDQGGVSGITSIVRDIRLRKKTEKQLARQNQELQTLSRLSLSVASSLEMDVVLGHILQQIMPLLESESLTVLLQEDEGLICRATGGAALGYAKGQIVPVDGLLASIMVGERPYLAAAINYPFYLENCVAPDGASQRILMFIPLRVSQETIGILQAIYTEEKAFDDSHLIQAAANWAAVAINHARQHARIQRQLRETEALAAINQALNESLELDKILQLIADSAQTLIPQLDQVVIHLLDEQERQLIPVIWSGVTDPASYYDSPASLLSAALSDREIAAYPDLREVDTKWAHFALSDGALLVAPLIANGERQLGTLSIRSLKPHAFLLADHVGLTRLASSAAIAIQSSNLYQSERSQRRIAEALVRAAKDLSQSLNLQDVQDMVLHQCRQVVACQAATLYLGVPDATRRQTTLSDARIPSLRLSSPEDQQALLEQAQVDLMLQTGKPVVVELKPPVFDPLSASLHLPDTIAAAPLNIGQQTIGFLVAHHDQPKHFSTSILRRLEALASHAALAIHNAQLYQDLRAALDQEQNMRQRLIQTEKLTAMGRMIASVAHEMNNPLQTIKNCLFISQRRVTPDHPTYPYLEMAASETSRMSDLVVQLRDVYRPRSSRDIVPLSVRKLIEDTQAILQPHLQQNHIRWLANATAVPPDCTTLGIPSQLMQVLLNISLNAVDAMQPDGGELHLHLLEDKHTNRIGLRLRDTGPGLDPTTISNLFEPFFTTKESGIGLGLAICYDIVQNHGGHIAVENVAPPERGAVFTVWLPCNGR